MRIGKQFRSLYRLFSSVRVISLDIHSTDIYIYIYVSVVQKKYSTRSPIVHKEAAGAQVSVIASCYICVLSTTIHLLDRWKPT